MENINSASSGIMDRFNLIKCIFNNELKDNPIIKNNCLDGVEYTICIWGNKIIAETDVGYKRVGKISVEYNRNVIKDMDTMTDNIEQNLKNFEYNLKSRINYIKKQSNRYLNIDESEDNYYNLVKNHKPKHKYFIKINNEIDKNLSIEYILNDKGNRDYQKAYIATNYVRQKNHHF